MPIKSTCHLKVFLIGFFCGILMFTATNILFYFVKDFSKSAGAQIDTDEALRARMEDFFHAPLPKTAGQLYYREEGFMDASYHVGLSAAPAEAWNLIRAYSGKEKANFRPPDPSSVIYEMNDTSLWNPAAMTAPLCLDQVVENQSRTLILYDEPSQRLLVHVSNF